MSGAWHLQHFEPAWPCKRPSYVICFAPLGKGHHSSQLIPPGKKYYESMNHRNIDKHLCHQRILSDQFKLFLGSYLIISNFQNFKVKIKWGRLKNEISVTSLSRLRSLNMLCLAACIANDKHSGFEGRRLFGGQYIYKYTFIKICYVYKCAIRKKNIILYNMSK